MGLCPFHDEKTPSFNVNPGLGIFKCFGCGTAGNVFTFLREIENITFPEAVRMLAERAGINLPESGEDREKYSETESIYHALRFAGRFFYHTLVKSEEGQEALSYLEGRGFTNKSIKKYGLGYAPDRWDALLNAAVSEHIEPGILEKAGLVIPRKEERRGKAMHYDRYRGRVIFPIFSHLGKVIGFGGRILVPAEKQPKYINSPETSVYHKSQVLYGLYHGKNAIRKKEEVILVEGYTDVLALHQAGIEHAVASSGTSLTTEQVALIKRYAKRVLVLYDSDAAGVNAALRGIELLLKQGVAVYGLELPKGEDPDSFIRSQGAQAFEEFMWGQKKDFIAFMHHLAGSRGQLDTPEGQAQLTQEIVDAIAWMPESTMHEPFIRRASEVLDVPDIPLFQALQKTLKKQNERQRSDARKRNASRPLSLQKPVGTPAAPPPSAPPGTSETPNPAETGVASESVDAFALSGALDDAYASSQLVPAIGNESESSLDPLPQEKLLLRIMLDHGAPMVEYIMGNMALTEFTKGVFTRAIQELLAMYKKGPIEKEPFLDGRHGPHLQALVGEVLMQRYEPSQNWQIRKNISIPRFNEDPHDAAESAMKQLKRRRVEEALSALKARIFQAQRRGDDVTPLLEERMALLEFQKQIEDPDFLARS